MIELEVYSSVIIHDNSRDTIRRNNNTCDIISGPLINFICSLVDCVGYIRRDIKKFLQEKAVEAT
jgi:hypothetical protein